MSFTQPVILAILVNFDIGNQVIRFASFLQLPTLCHDRCRVGNLSFRPLELIGGLVVVGAQKSGRFSVIPARDGECADVVHQVALHFDAVFVIDYNGTSGQRDHKIFRYVRQFHGTISYKNLKERRNDTIGLC